jgi:hypothetical protein
MNEFSVGDLERTRDEVNKMVPESAMIPEEMKDWLSIEK